MSIISIYLMVVGIEFILFAIIQRFLPDHALKPAAVFLSIIIPTIGVVILCIYAIVLLMVGIFKTYCILGNIKD